MSVAIFSDLFFRVADSNLHELNSLRVHSFGAVLGSISHMYL